LRSYTCIVRIENNEVQFVTAARTDNVNILLTETRGMRRDATRRDEARLRRSATPRRKLYPAPSKRERTNLS